MTANARLIPEDAVARRAEAERMARERPEDPAAWIALSEACQQLLEEGPMVAAARKAMLLAPENPDVFRRLANSLMQTGPGLPEARVLFQELLERSPNDPVALHYLHIFAMLEGDYRRAIELMKSLDQTHPGYPGTMLRIGRAHGLLGNSAAAMNAYRAGHERCKTGCESFPFAPYSWFEPLFARAMGNDELSWQLSRELCQEDGIGLANLSHPRYPRSCAQSIARLQQLVASRDLFLFGFGPSLAETVARKDELARFDFASMTLSSFQLIEENILQSLQRRVDFVCLTHLAMLRSQADIVEAWLADVPTGTLLVPMIMRDYATLVDVPSFLRNPGERVFWYDCFSEEQPPTPVDPLHLPAINTLICALGVAILAKPRRIFLFGFDGKMKGGDSQQQGALYFRENDAAYHQKWRTKAVGREYTRAWLWWDTLRFNELAPVTLRHLALLFDLPAPPIYNVNPESALDPFPRIPFDRFLDIAAVDRERRQL